MLGRASGRLSERPLNGLVTVSHPSRRPPVIVLLFANDRTGDTGGYLRNLPAEYRRLETIFEAVRGDFEVVAQPNVTHERLFAVLRRHRDRIIGVHLAGHADPSALFIEDEQGHRRSLHMEGFAGRLADMPRLRWVFLNGCGTEAHIAVLHARVAATAVVTDRAIRDDAACAFAAEFYSSLVAGSSLGESFAAARDRLVGQSGTEAYRFLRPAGSLPQGGHPWSIVHAPDRPHGDAWRLSDDLLEDRPRSPTRVVLTGVILALAIGVATWWAEGSRTVTWPGPEAVEVFIGSARYLVDRREVTLSDLGECGIPRPPLEQQEWCRALSEVVVPDRIPTALIAGLAGPEGRVVVGLTPTQAEAICAVRGMRIPTDEEFMSLVATGHVAPMTGDAIGAWVLSDVRGPAGLGRLATGAVELVRDDGAYSARGTPMLSAAAVRNLQASRTKFALDPMRPARRDVIGSDPDIGFRCIAFIH